MAFTFKQLQTEQKEWSAHNFPNRESYMPLLGVIEEVGELAHAHLKGEQSIRYTEDEVFLKKKDAIGDILIFLADYCTTNGLDMQEAIEDTWIKVKQRDWIKNPVSANKDIEGSI